MEIEILMNIDSFPKQEFDFDEASRGFIDNENEYIFEQDKTEEISFEVEKQRDIFIRMSNSTKLKKYATNIWFKNIQVE